MIVQILKNNSVIREYQFPVGISRAQQQSAFAKIHAKAGGMWNGKDKFVVAVKAI